MTDNVNKVLLQLQSTDSSQRGDALRCLQSNPISDDRIIPALVSILCTDNDLNIVEDATWIITRYDKKATPILLSRLSSDNAKIRHNIVHALGKIADVKALPQLINATQDSNASVRLKAVVALGQLGDNRAIDALISCLGDDVQDVSWTAREVIETFGAIALPNLIQSLNMKSVRIRELSANLLGDIGDTNSVESLIMATETADWEVRFAIVEALGNIGGPRALLAIQQMVDDGHGRVQAMAKAVLRMRNKGDKE